MGLVGHFSLAWMLAEFNIIRIVDCQQNVGV